MRKLPPDLPVELFWPAPDRRDQVVWPRPLTRHQREAARYRASKNRDKPWPSSWRREPIEIALTNGRVITVRLLAVWFGMLEKRPLTWEEHHRYHAEYVDAWSRAFADGGYILGGFSAWPGVAVCNRCARADDGRNYYVEARQTR